MLRESERISWPDNKLIYHFLYQGSWLYVTSTTKQTISEIHAKRVFYRHFRKTKPDNKIRLVHTTYNFATYFGPSKHGRFREH